MKEATPLDLTGEWTFRLAGSPRGATAAALKLDLPMSATVPGTVHYQLQRNGKIPDPWFDRNELSQQWIDEQDWEWSRTFTVSADDCGRTRRELIFDGIDTVATVYLNDKEIGHSRNMFRQVVLDVRGVCSPARIGCVSFWQAPPRLRRPRLNGAIIAFPSATFAGRPAKYGQRGGRGYAKSNAISAGTGASTWRRAESGCRPGSNAAICRASQP